MSDETPPADLPGDIPGDIPGETPVQKALRLKTARLDARPKPPRGGRFQREQAARVAAGKSKPWMTK
ncbi:hypothetical protein [Brevundimonas sp. SORGH_AS_0993]|uniref:hypothetical protein n=1 Tax=Brevundimonas sp. SORGH_AS_0993 TaxID=3041794 RepID=UPI002786CD7D|nr:hypothetical protein [Brevundimonas sp. SORGH_AS_0993]MDQ1155228.1 hypothetical protein [Brevundimonas sp. SORGH_AS_0993]